MRAALLLLLLGAGCGLDLHSGNLQCASGKRCPEGFHCAGDDHCWKDGSDPDLGVSADDLSTPNDLANSPPPDLAAADLRPAGDLGGADAASATKCVPDAALLCDSFEAAALDAQWLVTAGNGTVMLDSSRAYRGASSVHLHTGQVPDGGTGPEASIGETRTFPQAGKTIYLRVWTYVKSPYPDYAFDQFINVADSMTAGIAYVLYNGFPLLNAYTMPYVFLQGTTPPIPLDRWTCLQMSLTQTGTVGGTVHLMVDGVDSDASSAGNVATTAMVRVHIGLQFNSGGAGYGPVDAWIDEVMIDTNPISCDD